MPNKIYQAPETSITWTDATTGGDELLDMGGLAAGSLAMGSYYDRGAGSKAGKYRYQLIIDGFDTAPVVGETVSIYISQSDDGTNFDGQPTTAPTTTAEGTITADQVKNCLLVDTATVYSTTAGDELQVSGIVELSGRYISPVPYNKTADALLSTSDAHKFILTPIPDEVQ